MDALTLEPVRQLIVGGRLHHGQVFRDRYLLMDTFARDPDGLVWVHYDEDGNGRVVRDQGGFHGGIDPYRGVILDY